MAYGDKCTVIDFGCKEGMPFTDEKGCGCTKCKKITES